jgi:hypothetical protein
VKPVGFLAAAAVTVALCATPARADERKACIAAADAGQTLRDQGKLVAARQSFVSCAGAACPTMVATQCATWLAEVTREIPTVIFRATAGSGADLIGAQVSIDDAPAPIAVDGRAVPIDPGIHRLRFRHAGEADIRQEVVIRAGEKLRPVEVRFNAMAAAGDAEARPSVEAPPATPAPEKEEPAGFRFPLVAGLSLGVGAASFVAMGVLVGSASSDVNHLRATCAGSCSPADVNSANSRIVAANVAMGVGIAAMATAAVSLVVVNLSHGRAGRSQALSIGPGSVQLDLAF